MGLARFWSSFAQLQFGTRVLVRFIVLPANERFVCTPSSQLDFYLSIVNRGDWLWNPTNIKGANKDAKIFVGRSTTVHNLLFCPHTLCMSYVTNTFLLVRSFFTFRFQYCSHSAFSFSILNQITCTSLPPLMTVRSATITARPMLRLTRMAYTFAKPSIRNAPIM